MDETENQPAKRIVSLLPSATEIVCALGARDLLVGRSHECDFPVDVVDLPVCTAPCLDLSGSSRDIDQKVKQAAREATSVYAVLDDRLAELAPDIIVTQDQCDVCAVSLADVEDAVRRWTQRATEIVSLKPQSLGDVLADIVRVGRALGREATARRVADGLSHRAAALMATPARAARPRVACIEWTDPLMAAGNWVPELVGMAGGDDIFGRAGEHAPWITADALLEANPDIVVFMPCGFDLTRTEAEARAAFTTHPGLTDLRAARAGRLYATDGNAFFNRPGPRLVDSLGILAAVFADRADLPAGVRRLRA